MDDFENDGVKNVDNKTQNRKKLLQLHEIVNDDHTKNENPKNQKET